MPYVNYNKLTPWTKAMILEKLETDSVWVERALVVIYQRQTEWETRVDQSITHNDIGFQPADARWFSRFARQIIQREAKGVPAGERLSDRQLRYARRPWHRGKQPIPAVAKYRGQLLEIIEANAKAKLEAARAR